MVGRTPSLEYARLCSAVFDNLPVGLTILRLEDQDNPGTLRLIACNASAERLAGVARESAVGKTIAESRPAVLKTSLPVGLAEVIHSGQNRDFGEVVCVDAEGAFLVIAFPVGGNCVGVAFQKASRRTELGNGLHVSESMTRALLNAIPDLVLRVRRDGTIVDFIPAEDMPPVVPSGEFLGKKVREVLPREVARPTMHYVGRALRTGDTQCFEYDLVIGGRERHYEARIARSATDEVIAIVRDTTERKQLEKTLLEARDNLERNVERRMLRGSPYGLTFRELTVLHLVAEGKTDKQIATALSISRLTVQTHLTHILSKMRANSRPEAGVRALREGLLN